MKTQAKTFLSKKKFNSLKSKYLEEDYKNDLLSIDNIEIIDKNTLRTTLKVEKFVLDQENKFHLSAITATAFSQQMGIIQILLNLNKSEKDIEIYTTECNLRMLKPINSKVISIVNKIISIEEKYGNKFYTVSTNFENGSFIGKGLAVVKL